MKWIKALACAALAASALMMEANGATAAPAMTTASAAFAAVSAKLSNGALTAGTAADSGPFALRVAGRGDGFCLDNFASGNGENNSPVGLWACNGGTTETWRWRAWNADNYYGLQLVNERSGRCLDYPASAGNNTGWQINVYDCRPGTAPGQNFHVTQLSDGTLALTSQATTDVVALDAYDSQWHGNGSPVGLWHYWGDPGSKLQHWY